MLRGVKRAAEALGRATRSTQLQQQRFLNVHEYQASRGDAARS